MAYYIGLTGGIGSGKSLASDILHGLGAYVIDADQISRTLTSKDGEGARAIEREFGHEFFDEGELNRKKLREYVFTSSDRVQRLNAIMHSLVRQELKQQMQDATSPIVVVVVPLLFEAGFEGLFDEIWTISASRRKRIKRAVQRDNSDKKTVKNIIGAQKGELERLRLSDKVFFNNSTKQNLEKRLKKSFLAVKEHINQSWQSK